MRNRLPFVALLGLPLLVLGACTGDDPLVTGPTSQAGEDAGTAGFDLAEVAAITLADGKSVQVAITVTRAGFDGPINVSLTGLPADVTAPPVVVPGGQTTTNVSFSAQAGAKHGPRSLTMVATDLEGKRKREKPLALLVRGAPGALDNSFGTAGRVQATIGATGLGVHGVAVEADGHVLVGGNSDLDFALARLNADGSLDAQYGTGGKITADLRIGGDASEDYPDGLALDPRTGAAVLVGYRQSGAGTTHAIARVSASGALDTTFSTVGYAAPAFPQASYDNSHNARAALVQPDRKALLVGSVSDATYTYATVARFKENGALDDTFGNGKSGWFYGQSIAGNSNDVAEAVALAPDGKIVVAGSSTSGLVFALRLDELGNPDPGFGPQKGFSPVAVTGAAAQVHAVHLLADGRLLMTGEANAKLLVVRLTATGQLDTSFGGTGYVMLDAGAPVVRPSSVLDAAGRVVMVAGTGAEGDVLVARVTAEGTLDTTFGTNGVVVTKVGAKATAANMRIAQTADGRIVAATNLDTVAPAVVAYRFWP